MSNVYYQVSPTLVIGSTEKAGSRSIRHALRRCFRLSGDMVRARGLRARLYLRHPLTRFASAYAYFTANGHWPTRRQFESIEEFTDAVLAGCENEHWLPQLAQHTVEFDEICRFESIDESWPTAYPLGHYNQGRLEKPAVVYRIQELEKYYQEDLAQWNQAI